MASCSDDYNCCCGYAKANFKSLRPVGIGIIQEEASEHTELGEPYDMLLYLSKDSGIPPDDPGVPLAPLNYRTITAHNLAEMGNNESGTTCGDCMDARYIPGITGVAQNPSYPGSFTPQPICPGLSVVVFAISKSAADPYLGAINRSNCYTEGTLEVGCLKGGDALIFFFNFENAHDTTCIAF